MVISSVKVELPAEKYFDAIKLIRPILGPTSVKSGCFSINLYQDTDDSNIFMLLEKWETLSDLEDHIRSREYRNVLELMDISKTEPEIKFDTISKSEGFELIQALKSPRRVKPFEKQAKGKGLRV
jgi:quinol monooxygenase YgiN